MTKSSLIALAATLALAAPAAAQVKLNGAGATFPNIIYQDWMLSYNKTHPDVQLNYQSIGSGGGIRQFSDGTVDFGGSDAPMSDSAIAAIQGNVLHIPTVLGAIVIAYNLPGVSQQLKFTPDVIADIFLGKVTKWNDARLASVNPGTSLPATELVGQVRHAVARVRDGRTRRRPEDASPDHRFPNLDHQPRRRRCVPDRDDDLAAGPQDLRRHRQGEGARAVHLVGGDGRSVARQRARLRRPPEAVAALDRVPPQVHHG